MESLISTHAARIAIGAAGIYFMVGLLTGMWKYIAMRNSPRFEAPFYVNIAHRAALMYAFAALLLAVFASLSAFSETINMIGVIPPLLFFALAQIHYIQLGFANKTDNSMRDAPNRNTEFMVLNALTVAEIGGFAILLAGFFARIFGNTAP